LVNQSLAFWSAVSSRDGSTANAGAVIIAASASTAHPVRYFPRNAICFLLWLRIRPGRVDARPRSVGASSPLLPGLAGQSSSLTGYRCLSGRVGWVEQNVPPSAPRLAGHGEQERTFALPYKRFILSDTSRLQGALGLHIGRID